MDGRRACSEIESYVIQTRNERNKVNDTHHISSMYRGPLGGDLIAFLHPKNGLKSGPKSRPKVSLLQVYV